MFLSAFAALACLFVFSSVSNCDEIILNSGASYKGKIIEQTNDFVTIVRDGEEGLETKIPRDKLNKIPKRRCRAFFAGGPKRKQI